MKLREIRQTFYDASAKVSELSRHLAFAGIGLIWIFHPEKSPGVAVPPVLVCPAILFALALFFDLLQYIITTCVWGAFARVQEKRHTDPAGNYDVDVPVWMPRPQLVPFILKVGFVAAGYLRVLGYLWSIRPR